MIYGGAASADATLLFFTMDLFSIYRFCASSRSEPGGRMKIQHEREKYYLSCIVRFIADVHRHTQTYTDIKTKLDHLLSELVKISGPR